MFPIEAFQHTIDKAAEILKRHGIRFHLTGGVTSSLYADPRMTQDIDIVIDPVATQQNLEGLLSSLKTSDFLHSESDVRSAVRDAGLFQLFDKEEALKLDLYPRELIPGELDRSVLLEVFKGVRYPVASRIDISSAKLVWISKGSHKGRRDLRYLWRTATDDETDAIQSIAVGLGLEQLLVEVLSEPDEIE
ncbi:MAG: hypothetical protein KDA52_18805 [Planctomycetaceae bacterium]|nr:hypothetical protein [Planctomycetaceae bacterium]